MRALILAVGLLSGVALADVPPSDTGGCSSKSEGASCRRDDDSPGECTKATCSRLDYSHGSPPTGSIDYPCLKCTASASSKNCASVPGLEFGATALLLLLVRKRA